MLNYIVRRALYGVLILIGVNLATFFLFFTVNTPDDMARLNIGGKRVTPELIQKWKVERDEVTSWATPTRASHLCTAGCPATYASARSDTSPRMVRITTAGFSRGLLRS